MLPRDYKYIAVIAMLIVMLLISNGRMASQQRAHEDGVRLCETATRILDERVKELHKRVARVDAERIRLLGLMPKRLD